MIDSTQPENSMAFRGNSPNGHPGQKAIIEEYTRLAEIYDRKWSRYVQVTTRKTLAHLDMADGDQVLDVGCGTGTLLASIGRIRPTAEVWGIDITGRMLGVARNRLPESVHLCVGSADCLPVANDSFDAVVCCSMLHYLPDPLAALAEVLRVLRPGGQLVLTDWCNDYSGCRIIDRCLHLLRRPHFLVVNRIQRI